MLIPRAFVGHDGALASILARMIGNKVARVTPPTWKARPGPPRSTRPKATLRKPLRPPTIFLGDPSIFPITVSSISTIWPGPPRRERSPDFIASRILWLRNQAVFMLQESIR